MYTVTVKSIYPTTNGSAVGHAWITVSDGTNSISYGYYPKDGFDYLVNDPGELRTDDDQVHPVPDKQVTVNITKEQFDKLHEFSKIIHDNPPGYDVTGLAGGNCASFVQVATDYAGITDIPDALQTPFPWLLPDNIYYKYGGADKAVLNWTLKVSDKLSDWFGLNRDGTYYIYDPLVLDLDGDGIETIGHNKYYGAMFDLNANGIKNATGWIKGDDGILVFDRNQNGTIDNGAEVFGDATVLKNGDKAAHGFAALAEMDSNGDGKVNADDADFDKLKIWRDLNGDGVSQAGELFTLNELGIKALNLAYQDTAQGLGNGNSLAQTGSFEKTDGSEGKMGDVNFRIDTVHTQYTDRIELTPEQAQMANLKGIGWVRDLREAAALSPKLSEILKAYTAAETKAAQQALLPELVWEWAKTSPEYQEYKAPLMQASSSVTGGGGGAIGVTPRQGGVMEQTFRKAA